MLYLIKSTISLGILLVIYWLLLEKERMHAFKRFYLLLIPIFALVVPLISINIAPEIFPLTENHGFKELAVEQNINVYPKIKRMEETTDFLIPLIFVYCTGLLVLVIRFIWTIIRLSSKIRTNEQHKYKQARMVLLKEKVLPHTFLNNIFIYKTDFEQGKVEQELLAHELAHVQQKHSLDILFVELLQILFWFNPLFLLLKNAIKLNHEFLADESVLRRHKDTYAYQCLLIRKTSHQKSFSLTSNLIFSLTKKRLIMMTKKTNSHWATGIKLLLLPVFIGLLFAFSTKIMAQEKGNYKEDSGKKQVKPAAEADSLTRIRDNFYNNSTVRFGSKNKNGEMVYKSYAELSTAEKEGIKIPPVPERNTPTQDQLNTWLNAEKYGVWIDGQRVQNDVLKKYQAADFGNLYVSRLMPNAKNFGKHEFQLDLMTTSYFNEFRNRMLQRMGLNE